MKKKGITLFLLLLTTLCCVIGLSACNKEDSENKPVPQLTAIVGTFELRETPYQYGNLYILKWEYELYDDFTVKSYIAGTTLNGITDVNTNYGNYTHYDTENAIAIKWQNDSDIVYFTYENNVLSNGVQKFYLRDTNVEQPDKPSNPSGNNNQQQTHILTYDYNYNNAPNSTQKVMTGSFTNLLVPERNGYIFEGWYYNDNKIESGVWAFNEDIILTAQWGVIEYSVTLNANGGVIGEKQPDKLNIDSITTYTLPIPQKPDMNFVGWYEEADFSGEAITEITKETLKDYTLYAKYSNEQLCEFELSPDETYYSVIGYSGTPQYITIPSTYNGLPVSNIFANSFENCATLISINIPNTITKIGEAAFYGCSNLKNIYYSGIIDEWCKIDLYNSFDVPNLYINNSLLTDLVIPDSITEIKSYSFYGFTCIKSVTISDSVTMIGDHAFAGSGITTLQIGNSVENIEEYAFTGCNNLLTVVLPRSIKEIERFAFSEDLCKRYAGCYYLPIKNNDYGFLYMATQDTEIAKPHTACTHINAYAFGLCNLKSASISGNIKSIGYYAFYPYKGDVIYSGTFEEYCNLVGHENLFLDTDYSSTPQRTVLFKDVVRAGKINIPNTVNTIPSYTFYGYEDIFSVNIPDNIKTIGERAFSYCANIEYLKIGDGVTDIDSYAFYGCGSLNAIILGNNISHIGYNAFDFGKYPGFFYNGSVEDWEKINCDKLPSKKIYYYSKLEPQNNFDSYWHYDENEETPIILNKNSI